MRGRGALALLLPVALLGVAAMAYASSTHGGRGAADARHVSLDRGDHDSRGFDLRRLDADAGTRSRCMDVGYTGHGFAEVRLYGHASDPLASYLTVTVERGSLPAPATDCADFVNDTRDAGMGPGVLYRGHLGNFPAGWDEGVRDIAPGGWSPRERHAYRLTVGVDDAVGSAGVGRGARFTWEAR